jgi:hypothetical protein
MRARCLCKLIALSLIGSTVPAQNPQRLTATEIGRLGNTRVDFMKFTTVGDVYRAPDGWTYLLEPATQELRAFGPDGLAAWVVGRRDFGTVRFGRWANATFAVAGDTIAVLDPFMGAVHFIHRLTGTEMKASRGRSVITFRKDRLHTFARLAPTDAGWVIVSQVVLAPPPPPSEETVPAGRMFARRFSLTDSIIRDTLWSGVTGVYSIWVYGDRQSATVPFASTRAWTVGRDGLFAADSGTQVWIYKGGRTPPRRLEMEIAPTPITPAMVTSYFEQLEQRQIDTLNFPSRRALVPPVRNAVGSIRVAPDGSTAIVRADLVATPADPKDSVFVDILQAGGRRGLVALPPGFELRQFTGSQLIGVLDNREVCATAVETGVVRYCRDIVTYQIK